MLNLCHLSDYSRDGLTFTIDKHICCSGVTRRYYYDDGIVAYTKDGTSVSSSNVLSADGDILGTCRDSAYYTYTKDTQNSTESIVKSDGMLAAAYTYTDFGETAELTGSNFDNEICYTGAVYDAKSGLYYMNARYYDPENGRFMSQDTYRGELDELDQWHLYAYCANNPINYIDPTGHFVVRRWMVSLPVDVILTVYPVGFSFKVFNTFKKAGKAFIRGACKTNEVLRKYKSLYVKYNRAMNNTGQSIVKKVLQRYVGIKVKKNKGVGYKVGRLITETSQWILSDWSAAKK